MSASLRDFALREHRDFELAERRRVDRIEFEDAARTYGASADVHLEAPGVLRLRGQWWDVERAHRRAEAHLGIRFRYRDEERPNGTVMRLIELDTGVDA